MVLSPEDRPMATNLALDDNLIAQAVKAGSHRTKREAVTAALQEYVKLKRRLALLEMEGQVDFDPTWDYKADRRRGNRRIPRAG
jgi:Arc/MetJ family transcription regulator